MTVKERLRTDFTRRKQAELRELTDLNDAAGLCSSLAACPRDRTAPRRCRASSTESFIMAHSGQHDADVDYRAKRTRDHETIRRWAEERGGRPTMVEGTQILRIDFDDPDGRQDEKLKPVSWDEFFRVFDDRDLEFLYQERTHDGGISRFYKFVRSGTDDEQR
jgi:hypothetical protein